MLLQINDLSSVVSRQLIYFSYLPQSFFTHYGILWFSLAEFIPRGGSSLALLLFMSKRSHQVSRREIRQRYAGSDFGVGTVLSSAKDLSSSMEHSSLSSINGHLLAHVSFSVAVSLLRYVLLWVYSRVLLP